MTFHDDLNSGPPWEYVQTPILKTAVAIDDSNHIKELKAKNRELTQTLKDAWKVIGTTRYDQRDFLTCIRDLVKERDTLEDQVSELQDTVYQMEDDVAYSYQPPPGKLW